MKRRKIIKTIIILLSIIGVSFLIFFIYFGNYYHASDEVEAYYNNDGSVEIKRIEDGLFLDGEGAECALVFYPGAKVEYTSYLPLLYEIARKGVDVFLLKMPFNFPLFAPDMADDIIDAYNYESWYIAGHSLGGVAASVFAYENSDELKGVIFLASFPTEDLSNSSLDSLSIYGTQDAILNTESYEKAKMMLPAGFAEVVIEGGNHALFGLYGEQKGDGKALITPYEQREKTADAVSLFIIGDGDSRL